MGETTRRRSRRIGRTIWTTVAVTVSALGIGGEGPAGDVGAETAATSCSAAPWNSGAFYEQGAQVSHNEHQWRANSWLWAGVEPGVSGAPPWWVPWQDLGACTPTTPTIPKPPGQPTGGPGGSDYPHGDWDVRSGGTGNDAWYVFQPTNPRPATAPVAVMLHGFGEYSGYNSMYEFVRHTVRKGFIVVYPRWQTGPLDPGFSIEATMAAARNGITGALGWLRADPTTRVQPRLDEVGYFGFSWGGIIAANFANRHASLGLPTLRSLLLFEPSGGALGDPFDASMSGIPSTTRVVCMVSQGMGVDRSCGTLFPKLAHISPANKDFVTMYGDTLGDPDLIANHQAVCSPPAPGQGTAACDPNGPEVTTNALDYYAFWKSWVALQSCANRGADCAHALNDTPEHRFMGAWSSGTAVRPLRIGDTPAAP